MSERIERWVNVYSDGSLGTFWDSPPPTLPHARVAHFVEIRDGEDIVVNGETDGPPLVSGVDPASGKDGAVVVTMAPWPLVDDARKERDAAIERAEKAEAALQGAEFAHEAASKNAKGWHDRALSAESQLNDARKRYRDDTAAKLLAAEYADNDAALPAGTTTDQYWINRAKWALIVAQHLTDAAFGFPPAKEVSNG